MKNASASDNDNIKSFFIEEKSLNDIADYAYLTYVAIDDSNHVTKQRVSVNVAPEVKEYHIEALKPLQIQLKSSLKMDEYLALRNECGWDIKDTFIVESVDYNTAGIYDAKITAKKHNNVEPLYASLEVADFKAPRIILNTETYRDWANKSYDDEYFLSFIDHIEDDSDDVSELSDKVIINWKEAMSPSSTGYMRRGGTYEITYRVTDSEGNTGRAVLNLILDVPVYNTTEGEE
ncbi:MAG: hypothetical protein IKS54_07485 [Erysipelotrichaceae bacterium]|nr:hypothetical protein [Erysipelotrichaceae bacterium]